MMACCLIESYRRFGGTCCLHHHSIKVSNAGNEGWKWNKDRRGTKREIVAPFGRIKREKNVLRGMNETSLKRTSSGMLGAYQRFGRTYRLDTSSFDKDRKFRQLALVGLMYYPKTCVVGLRKITQNINRNNRSPGNVLLKKKIHFSPKIMLPYSCVI
jgi:hypothetical protein